MRNKLFTTSCLTILLSMPCQDVLAVTWWRGPGVEKSQLEIYSLAKKGNLEQLKDVSDLDIVDAKGNTALCQAELDNNVDAYRILIKAGASETADCFKKIPPSQGERFLKKVVAATVEEKSPVATSSFLGLSSTQLTIGGVIAAAGIAAAVGGGGGGGGSGGAEPTPTPVPTEIILKERYNNGTISFENSDNLSLYGVKASAWSGFATNAESQKTPFDDFFATITLFQNKDNDVYGVYGSFVYNTYLVDTGTLISGGIAIENNGTGNAYGIYSTGSARNAYNFDSSSNSVSQGEITILNNGTGNAYGLYSKGAGYNSYASDPFSKGNISVGYITVLNNGTGNGYGLYSESIATNIDGEKASGAMTLSNSSGGNIYGIYAKEAVNAGYMSKGLITLYNNSYGSAYGMYADDIYSSKYSNKNEVQSAVQILNSGNGKAFGFYGKNITNSEHYYNRSDIDDTIFLINAGNGKAVGMYVVKNGTAENKGSIVIDNLGYGTAIGIYAEQGATVNNTGTITINRTAVTIQGTTYSPVSATGGTAYGIYAEAGATVSNTGTISLTGNAAGEEIKLNGASLFNAGTLSASSIDLAAMGGEVVLEQGGNFKAQEKISGNLNVSDSFVQNGFQTSYLVENVIDSPDTSGLMLASKSALFRAGLSENGEDIVLTMKAFDELTNNKSLAKFLTNNYALQNNEGFFSTLKSAGSLGDFTKSLNALAGTSVFNNFAQHDLSVMRTLNLNVNKQMFSNFATPETKLWHFSNAQETQVLKSVNENSLSLVGINVSPFVNIGYGMAISNYETISDEDSKQDTAITFMLPVSFQKDDYKAVSSFQIGYAKGYYERQNAYGSYDGYLERRTFSLMNEARYGFDIGALTIEPTVQANGVLYDQSGKEDEKLYSLTIPHDRFLSIEGGIGLNLGYKKQLEEKSCFEVNAGAMLYREFSDSYTMKIGMNGMDGTFDLYEGQSKNYATAHLGFAYQSDGFKIGANLFHFMKEENDTRITAHLSWLF